MSDDEIRLIQRAKDGDRSAFAEIFRRHQSAVFHYVLSLAGDVGLAEDVTGEVFVRLVEKIDQFTYQGKPLLAWLFAIARNLVRGHHRQGRGVTEIPLNDCLMISTADTAEETAICHMTQEQLAAAIARLTEGQRQVILLRFIEGLDIESVARVLDKPMSAVKSLQHRGLAALRRILAKKSG